MDQKTNFANLFITPQKSWVQVEPVQKDMVQYGGKTSETTKPSQGGDRPATKCPPHHLANYHMLVKIWFLCQAPHHTTPPCQLQHAGHHHHYHTTLPITTRWSPPPPPPLAHHLANYHMLVGVGWKYDFFVEHPLSKLFETSEVKCLKVTLNDLHRFSVFFARIIINAAINHSLQILPRAVH